MTNALLVESAPAFAAALAEALSRRPKPAVSSVSRNVYVAYDQLTDQVGLLREQPAERTHLVLVESEEYLRRRPYHRAKVALLLANQRQFALEQARRGCQVDYLVGPASIGQQLRGYAQANGPLVAMTPAERELRVELKPLCTDGLVEILPNPIWITEPADLRNSARSGPPWRMDAFYRLVRKKYRVLVERGKPVGGKWSFDAENRQPWSGTPPAAVPPTFHHDAISDEVFATVRQRFDRHPGQLDPATLPATAAHAEAAWTWAKQQCLPNFGPFEDAMSTRSTTLFHTRLSALLNVGRLLPARLVREAETLPIPLAGKEGFIRQILGWREFVHQVHDATDGFREGLFANRLSGLRQIRPEGLEGEAVATAACPGDGGWSRWAGQPWAEAERSNPAGGQVDSNLPILDGGACPGFLEADQPLPNAYWGQPSGLHCLDTVVADVWREGWSHHITRLMVLANIASLLGVSPRELTDWFWVAYVDAFDWVVEPNVLAMGTYATGPLMTTKPYISGAAYIHRMSDYCGDCRYDPKSTCPLTRLYWAYLARHRERLADNPRLGVVLRAQANRPLEVQAADQSAYVRVNAELGCGTSQPDAKGGLF